MNEQEKKILNTMKLQYLRDTFYSRMNLGKLLERTERDIDSACNYPLEITLDMYQEMFRRNGIANRAVRFMPIESWKMLPDIYEVEDTRIETQFEKDIKEIIEKNYLFSYLKRADILSGICRYGILFLGIDDGKEPSEPVEGIDENGRGEGVPEKNRNLLYLRVYKEINAPIIEWETRTTSPRYGKPLYYSIRTTENPCMGAVREFRVHWTRVIHLADNREESDVFGTPRMEPIWNMLLDIRKLLGGSAEMFWRGAFPGYAFEVSPELQGSLNDVEIDSDTVREEFEKWASGLQRYMAMTGVRVHSLSPQVADPSQHIEAELKAIALSIGVPYRVFIGTEEAKLSSSQDVRSWNARIDERREGYLTDFVIRPTIDRLIGMGVVARPEHYTVEWPDLNILSDLDQADVVLKQTSAMAQYVSTGVDQLVPPREYLTMFLKKTMGEARQIEESAVKRMDEFPEEMNVPEGDEEKKE